MALFLCIFFPGLPGPAPLSPASPKRCRGDFCAPLPMLEDVPRVGGGGWGSLGSAGSALRPGSALRGPAAEPRPRKWGARVPRPPLPTRPRPETAWSPPAPQPSSPGGLSARLNGNIASKSRFRERPPLRSAAEPRVSPPARPRSRLESLAPDESYGLVCALKPLSGFIRDTHTAPKSKNQLVIKDDAGTALIKREPNIVL